MISHSDFFTLVYLTFLLVVGCIFLPNISPSHSESEEGCDASERHKHVPNIPETVVVSSQDACQFSAVAAQFPHSFRAASGFQRCLRRHRRCVPCKLLNERLCENRICHDNENGSKHILDEN